MCSRPISFALLISITSASQCSMTGASATLQADLTDLDRMNVATIDTLHSSMRIVYDADHGPAALHAPLSFESTDDSTTSFSFSGGGLGAVQGGGYTIPAYARAQMNFTFHMTAVSMNDMKKFNALAMTMLEASKQSNYSSKLATSASGGWSIFSGPRVEASTSYCKETMDSWGLSEANQKELLEKLFKLAAKPNTYHFAVEVDNHDHDFSVSGNVYFYSFDGLVKVGDKTSQKRMLGGPMAKNNDGSQLPVTATLQ